MKGSKKAYAAAGVDVDLGNRVKSGIHALVKGTHGPEVLGKIGGFGGLFRANFKGMKDPVLVSSVDGVGTKLKLAFAANKHDTVGQCLVNHCVNDIAVVGARPLFFLDYIGGERLDPPVFKQLIKGFAKACKEAGCALIGGETAQMPGMYQKGEYDLAGTIVGVVDRAKALDGSKIKVGDVIIGLAANGLHTNGYSLARRIVSERLQLAAHDVFPESGGASVADVLLKVHRSYLPLMRPLLADVCAMAHITGGGLPGNLNRALPDNCDAIVDTSSWTVPAEFRVLAEAGRVSREEMFRAFNMGVGMVVIAEADKVLRVMSRAAEQGVGAWVMGEVAHGTGVVQLDRAVA